MIGPLLFAESEAFARREEGSRLVDQIETLWEAIGNPSTSTRWCWPRVGGQQAN